MWGIWQQNVGLPQLLEPTEVLCAAAKWYGEEETLFVSKEAIGKDGMMEFIHGWLDEADAVVSYNGMKFDIPHLNREFLELCMAPPSPFKQIDLLKTAKSQFRFPSNKLDYIATKLGIGSKVKHAGHKLWMDCMAGDAEAWKKMEEYNREDVVLTEKLYDIFKPWIKGHPNVALYQDNGSATADHVCTRCGEQHKTIKQGFAYTGVSKFQQYQCKACNCWFRGRTNLAPRDGIGMNIL